MMIDPKEVLLTDRNASCPRTKIELLEWFERDGIENKRLRTLIKLGKYENYPELWNAILNYNLAGTFVHNAWVSRSGKVWTCGYAQHEFALNYMGLVIVEVEDAGWLRVSGIQNPRGFICRAASSKQLRFAFEHNVSVFEYDEKKQIITSDWVASYENS